MRSNLLRPVAIIIALAVLGVGVFVFVGSRASAPVIPAVKVSENLLPVHEVIGQSVEGKNIDAYTYLPRQAGGTETTRLLFTGGMHGGYEWNSVLLAYKLMDYLDKNPEIIPGNLSVTVIPSINPDGVYKVVSREGRFSAADVSTDAKILAAGRFNADNVDLNRNFDCKWQPKSTWQSKIVSAGAAPFSEPEAAALKNYILKNNISAAIFWHSKSNAVYASQCENGILPMTLDIMNAYSEASGYPAVKTFDAYATTGAADDWLSSEGIPAITVELKTHEDIEWSRNLAGIEAIFKYYSPKKP